MTEWDTLFGEIRSERATRITDCSASIGKLPAEVWGLSMGCPEKSEEQRKSEYHRKSKSIKFTKKTFASQSGGRGEVLRNCE